MFNTIFSNKTQLKIIFFYFVRSDPVQCIFSVEPDRSSRNSGACFTVHGKNPWTVEHAPLFIKGNPWIVELAPLLMSFPAQEATNCFFKLVDVPQLTVGPTSRNLLWKHCQTGELLWLLQTQKQPRNQTPSNLPLCKTFLDLQNWYYWFPTIALDFFFIRINLFNSWSN